MSSSFFWTLTSTNTGNLKQIRHSLKNSLSSKGRKGKEYKCEVCNHVSKTFGDASRHFLATHMKCDSERKILEEAIYARRNCLPKITNIKDDIMSGCNVPMAINQLQMISEELTKHLNLLYDFDKTKLLPAALYRKKREMCNALSETIKSMEATIKTS